MFDFWPADLATAGAVVEVVTGFLKASLLVSAVRDLIAAVVLGFVVVYVITGRK